MVSQEFLDNFGKECWYIFYMNYYNFSNYNIEMIGSTEIKKGSLFEHYMLLTKRQIRKDKDKESLEIINTNINTLKNFLKKHPLKALFTGEVSPPFNIEELKDIPLNIRIKCGEYRLLLARDIEYKKILLLGAFHRREGYLKALEIYKETLDKGANNDILVPMSPSRYSFLKRKIKIDDNRSIRHERF